MPFPPPGDLSNPEIEPASSVAAALWADSLPLSHRGSTLRKESKERQNHIHRDALCGVIHPTAICNNDTSQIYADRPYLKTLRTQKSFEISELQSQQVDQLTGSQPAHRWHKSPFILHGLSL